MHGNRHISAFRKLWLAAMAFAALSCNEDVIGIMTGGQTSGPEFSPTSEVTVEFNILNPDAAPDTRVDDPQEWTDLDGTSAENKINNIYLFAVDYDTETGEETVEEVVKADLVPGDFTPAGVRTGHTFKLSSGTKRFYVGANMTEAHVQAFRNKTAMRADSYDSALAMVMDNYDTKTGEGTNILMFSAPAKDASDKTDIEITTSRFISISANLERLVSKVMVVAKYTDTYVGTNSRKDEKINYMKSTSLNGFFIDFQFVLNNTNKALSVAKIYDVATAANDEQPRFNTDPNWDIRDWVRYDATTQSVISTDIAQMTDNFSFWENEVLESRFYTPTLPGDIGTNNIWFCSNIPASTSSAVTNDKFDYTSGKGLYCLENTVFDGGFNESYPSADRIKAAFLTTTHVYLRARFIPINIVGAGDGPDMNGAPPGGGDETVRIDNLYWNSDASKTYHYTFYVDKEKGRYFTYTGADRWITNPQTYTKSDGTAWTWSDFEPYIGGWVYFKTFFEEGGKGTQDGTITYEGIDYWGIRRNDYCILTINEIENWGSTDPGEAYIKVKSETVPWNKKGSSDVTVTPE